MRTSTTTAAGFDAVLGKVIGALIGARLAAEQETLVMKLVVAP